MKLQHLISFHWLKNSDVTACWSGLASGCFAILREHPLRKSNQQPNFPRKKKPKHRDLSKSFELFDVSYYKGVQLSLT